MTLGRKAVAVEKQADVKFQRLYYKCEYVLLIVDFKEAEERPKKCNTRFTKSGA